MTGVTTLGASANLSLSFLSGYTPVLNNTFQILTATSVVGQFLQGNSITINSNGNDYTFGIAYNPANITLTLNAIAIPEPSTFAAMAGLGILGLAVTRRRRSV